MRLDQPFFIAAQQTFGIHQRLESCGLIKIFLFLSKRLKNLEGFSGLSECPELPRHNDRQRSGTGDLKSLKKIKEIVVFLWPDLLVPVCDPVALAVSRLPTAERSAAAAAAVQRGLAAGPAPKPA